MWFDSRIISRLFSLGSCSKFQIPANICNFVFILHLGVKNADEAELRQVASEPVDSNVYNVNDFHLLSKLVARLVHVLCGRIDERGIIKRKVALMTLTQSIKPQE